MEDDRRVCRNKARGRCRDPRRTSDRSTYSSTTSSTILKRHASQCLMFNFQDFKKKDCKKTTNSNVVQLLNAEGKAKATKAIALAVPQTNLSHH